jgi:hypothetical protein
MEFESYAKLWEKKTHKGSPLPLLQKVPPLFYILYHTELELTSKD